VRTVFGNEIAEPSARRKTSVVAALAELTTMVRATSVRAITRTF
jgi:hypothetical protein